MIKFAVVVLLFITTLHGCNGQEKVEEALKSIIEATGLIIDGEFTETLVTLYDTINSRSHILRCVNETPALSGFSERVKSMAQLMASTAHSAETIVKAAGEKKVLQEDIAELASSVWIDVKELYTRQQLVLVALDQHSKSLIMQRSEEIGHDIRNGSQEFNIAKVKEELNIELEYVKAIAASLSPSIKEVVGDVTAKAIKHIWINQVVNALTKGPLEATLRQDADVIKYYPFTQYAITEGVSRVSSLRQEILLAGLDTIDEYNTFTENTVNQTSAVQEEVNTISVTLPCRDIETKITEAVTRLNTIRGSISQNEVKTAEKERDEIDSLDAKVVNEIMFAADNGVGGMKATLDEIVNSLPEESKRSAKMQEAATALSQDISSTVSLSELNETLSALQPHVKFLLKVYSCYVKTLEVVGRVIEGCSSGAGNFESIYTQVNSLANTEDAEECSRDAMITAPTKEEVKATIQTVASKLKFNPDCTSNKQNDLQPAKLNLQFQEPIFGGIFKAVLKVAETVQICNLRNVQKLPDEEIAKKVKKTVEEVKAAVCVDRSRRRRLRDEF